MNNFDAFLTEDKLEEDASMIVVERFVTDDFL